MRPWLVLHRRFREPLRPALLGISLACLASAAVAEGIRLEGWDYPFEEHVFTFESQRQSLEMVYMDLEPEGEAVGTVVLLHGKNFTGSYFEETARALARAGFRVVMPDQIGFGKSSKPAHYQFSFHQLARNAKQLLDELGIESAHVLGHSMGGMVATRFALTYPDFTDTLTLLNPIGLEDWKAKGVPYRPIDDWYEGELSKTPDKIRAYQMESYYDGKWREAYDPWVEQLAAFLDSPDYPRMAWVQALGKDSVSKKIRASLGNYPRLGRSARDAIPNAELVELDGIGHLPHIEAFDRFIAPYLAFLQKHER